MGANHSVSRRGHWLLPALALVFVTLAAASVGTLTWMRYARSLQTITKISSPILTIQGSTPGTLAMNLGDIDVESGNRREYVFGVSSNQTAQYKLQLAHTTNIPLTYTIYHATKGSGTGSVCMESGISFYYSSTLDGHYLNQSAEDQRIAEKDGTYHNLTYKTDSGNYSNVQTYAEPLYWQSSEPKSIASGEENTQFYVLVVSWGSGLKNDKETDMIYLTAFTGGT